MFHAMFNDLSLILLSLKQPRFSFCDNLSGIIKVKVSMYLNHSICLLASQSCCKICSPANQIIIIHMNDFGKAQEKVTQSQQGDGQLDVMHCYQLIKILEPFCEGLNTCQHRSGFQIRSGHVRTVQVDSYLSLEKHCSCMHSGSVNPAFVQLLCSVKGCK